MMLCIRGDASVTIVGEWFVCANVLLDAACLHAVARSGGRRIRAGRIVLSSCLGTACAMASMIFWGYRAAVYAALPIAALMALLAFGAQGITDGMSRLMFLALAAAGAARVMHDLRWHALAVVLALLPGVMYFVRLLMKWRSHAGERAEIKLFFENGGVALDGIVDSGNMLRDPVTALPVVVVSFQAVQPLLPGGVVLDRYDTLPRGYRLISVHTAAGTALLMCFRPRALYVRHGRVWRAAEAVIAVSGALEGRRALLPPTMEL